MHDEDESEEFGPCPDDYTVTPSGPLGGLLAVGRVDGTPRQFLGEFREHDDAIRAIAENMEAEQFWPNVWSVSDHGNWSLLNMSKELEDCGR